MDSKSSRDIFQYVLMGVFAVVAALSVVILATYKPGADNVVDTTPITIWGPLFGSQYAMPSALAEIIKKNKTLTAVTYVAKPEQTMYRDLLQAVAEGNAPDIVLFDAASLLELQTQLYPISYEQVSLRQFRDTYVEGAEIFALQDNIYAYPILVDPLVMYWNRDLFTSALVTQVPTDWDTFVKVVPRLSTVERGADLKQAGVAFGEYDNVLHAREIVSALMLQTGTPMVRYDLDRREFISTLIDQVQGKVPAELALTFFTDFSNPRKTVYAWNKTFQRSREAFTSNQVALYAGFASEASVLASINPNLNFDVSMWPQSVRGGTKVTYGKFYGLGVVRNGQHVARALAVQQALSTPEALSVWSKYTKIPSTHRGLLVADPTDPFGEVLIRSAIISRSWLAPYSGNSVDDVFKQMINEVTSGRQDVQNALRQASEQLDVLLTKYKKPTE